LVQVLEHYGAALGAEGPYQDSVKKQVMEETPRLTTAEYKKRTVLAAKKKSVVIGVLERADRKHYGGLWSNLENLFTRGKDHYPSDLTGAYNLLLNYYKPSPHSSMEGVTDTPKRKMRSVASLSCRTQCPYQEQTEPCTNESSATIARTWGIT
jgi:hypothetical protein